ncbi:hypothetical protein ISF_05372 [Cordyceps fumosorosea ARSEF 2679]|uniref:Uncharacterized protein n=1 Tax=Cordyceps fumosorosea (strain ARSEF 2679) TaxID=1081104 RepID=A0A167V947_CORFA|nr:hypothetical protein ISF_05372 [Cordyceps fumosorosea ARSEF 2679]OAA62363.1 hypothetical protein ISF_05372 [Cordyceps fumosorosea ARSEF 2679]
MPRLVRRKPLLQRISAVLNPMDSLLWLSEELETRDWDSENAGTQLGLGLNFVFLLARANSGSAQPADDVFGGEDKSLWLSLVVNTLVWGLGVFAVTNGVYTLTRTRKYRMFEANIDVQPGTPSARRVQVQGSPASSSPLRFLTSMITPDTPESRAHPDKKRDVWELAVWDPLPISLRLFCLFGPAHVLVYIMFLPLASLDPRPSITVFNTLVLQAILSAQLLLFCSKFAQQGKDNSIIQKEVMHEYDTKFVHPLMHPIVRDVGVQVSTDAGSSMEDLVDTGTPTTLIRRSFKTHKNPHIDEEESAPLRPSAVKPNLFTPSGRRSDSFSPMPTIRSSDSVATHVLDSNLARADHVLRLRKQARQERRALKESGDYLGVQGVNPETGRMDVETPTDSEGSQLSPVPPIEEQVRPKRMIVTFDEKVTEKEKKKMLLKAREAELRRMEKSKKEAEELANQLMWRRHTKEWSIVKDPGVDSLPRKQTAMLAGLYYFPI